MRSHNATFVLGNYRALRYDSAFFVIDVAAITRFLFVLYMLWNADSPYQRSHDSR